MLAGCKIELPNTSNSLQSSASSFESSSMHDESSAAVSSVSSSQSAVASSAVSSAAQSKAASSGAPSKSTSSKPSASKIPPTSKSSAPAAEQSKEESCALFISCSEILKNKDKFSEDKLSIVPAEGLIYEKSSIPFEDGDTVFDVLVREMKANKIQMEYTASPVYQTNYLKGIDNIYEKDFGSSSGWMYVVNGKQPPVGCNSYKLKSGDKIQWLYICGQ